MTKDRTTRQLSTRNLRRVLNTYRHTVGLHSLPDNLYQAYREAVREARKRGMTWN